MERSANTAKCPDQPPIHFACDVAFNSRFTMSLTSDLKNENRVKTPVIQLPLTYPLENGLRQ